jgi:hypothetical protein
MPSVSKKQHNLMAAVANNPKFAKKVGVPRSVGEEFLTADKGKKFRSGGEMKKKMRKFQDGGETARESSGGMEYLKSLTRAEPPKSGVDRLRSDIKAAGRAGMSAAKTAAESIPVVRGAKELASRISQKSMPKSYDEEIGMKKGGKVHSDIAKDKPMMKKVAAKAVKGHEKRMHGMAKGGKVGQLSKADGCAVKGKSKGTMIKMNKGGYC